LAARARDHGRVRFVLTRDPEEFAAHAAAFLEERVECNVMATVLGRTRRAGALAHAPLFARGVDRDGRVLAAALRTPPWPLLASELEPAHAEELMEDWLAHDPGVPGVVAPVATARALAGAWSRRTAGRARCRMREAMHLLTEVRDPPRPAAGELRLAREGDAPLLAEWERAFMVEAGVGVLSEAERTVARRLAEGAQLLWDDGGAVATVVLAPEVAGTVRVGPVYTPPERRCRGYASSAVAAACRRALGAGAQRCMLFTDLANPTSNRIYAAVGFRRGASWEEHVFERAAHSSRS
jgi:RimJ/RimL family protein N-acetyltransferase